MHQHAAESTGNGDQPRRDRARVRAQRFGESFRPTRRERIPLGGELVAAKGNAGDPRRRRPQPLLEKDPQRIHSLDRSIEQRSNGNAERHDEDEQHDQRHHRRGERAAPAKFALHPQQHGPGCHHDGGGPHQRPDEGQHGPETCHQQHPQDEDVDGDAGDVRRGLLIHESSLHRSSQVDQGLIESIDTNQSEARILQIDD